MASRIEVAGFERQKQLLTEVLSPGGLVADDDIGAKYYTDSLGRPGCRPRLLVRPASTAEVSSLLKLCSANDWPLVTQGGMTGLVSAALPRPNEIVLSLDRMTRTVRLDTNARTMTVEAGINLQTVQESAEAEGLIFPLDLASRGSATIGGVISTNAGGTMVLRYGMVRELVIGLEAVLADGSIINSMYPYLKNNTGHDVKQYFIGTEGTLGIVTKAILRLYPRPKEKAVALCSAPGLPELIALLGRLQQELEGGVVAFEAMWASYYEMAIRLPNVRAPLPAGSPFYVLVEAAVADGERRLETALGEALGENLISDAVIAKSMTDARSFWDVRELVFEALATRAPYLAFDVSLHLDCATGYLNALEHQITAELGQSVAVTTIAHLGDNNLHVAVHFDSKTTDPRVDVKRVFYRVTGEFRGSVSAEHGIGIDKRDFLRYSRTAEEIALMKNIKRTMDPKNILNRGRIFELY